MGGRRPDVLGADPAVGRARGGVKQIRLVKKPIYASKPTSQTFCWEKTFFFPRAACFPPRVAMDAVYRAMDGGSGRVALSDAARRRKDRDAARRARRKGYAAGLTSTLVDAYWREATESVGNRRVAPPNAPVTMSGEQAVAFFSRSGLPNGEEPRSRAARAAPGPRPAALYPKPRRVCFSWAFFFASTRSN